MTDQSLFEAWFYSDKDRQGYERNSPVYRAAEAAWNFKEALSNCARQYSEDEAALEIAKTFVVSEQRASISGIQRHMKIGYNQACQIMEQLEKRGVVTKPDDVGGRRVLRSYP